jgi:hypothetical protein
MSALGQEQTSMHSPFYGCFSRDSGHARER